MKGKGTRGKERDKESKGRSERGREMKSKGGREGDSETKGKRQKRQRTSLPKPLGHISALRPTSQPRGPNPSLSQSQG